MIKLPVTTSVVAVYFRYICSNIRNVVGCFHEWSTASIRAALAELYRPKWK